MSDGFLKPTKEHVQMLFRVGEIGQINGRVIFTVSSLDMEPVEPLIGEYSTVYGLWMHAELESSDDCTGK